MLYQDLSPGPCYSTPFYTFDERIQCMSSYTYMYRCDKLRIRMPTWYNDRSIMANSSQIHVAMEILWTPPSVRPSCYLLLNHWLEFNQTCYVTTSHGKGVWEQHYFSVRPSGRQTGRPSGVHLSITPSYRIYSVIRLPPPTVYIRLYGYLLFGYKTAAYSSKIIANIWISLGVIQL